MDKHITTKVNLLNQLEGLSRQEALGALADAIENMGDLDFLANLVRKDFEPSITADSIYEECGYDEGNDTAGHISLVDVLGFVEDILTKSSIYNIKFSGFVRPENKMERAENGHNNDVIWYTFDETVNIKDFELQFETE